MERIARFLYCTPVKSATLFFIILVPRLNKLDNRLEFKKISDKVLRKVMFKEYTNSAFFTLMIMYLSRVLKKSIEQRSDNP